MVSLDIVGSATAMMLLEIFEVRACTLTDDTTDVAHDLESVRSVSHGVSVL